MKEKQTYRRFDLPAFLAILGCIGMLIFECVFIFELYDRAPAQVANLLPVRPLPGVKTNSPQPGAAAPVHPSGNTPAPVAAPAG